MAKSSRSKWKKLHRRQRAVEAAGVIAGRVCRLNEKLRLAATGGLSAVPMEDPETRYHFVNPEIDTNVPNKFKGLKNNYGDLAREPIDFNMPLQLRQPRTNFRGKSDTSTQHPMTREYDVVSTTAPVAGHAISVADVRRMAAEPRGDGAESPHANGAEADGSDGMEEFVLSCDYDAPLGARVAKKSKRSGAAKVTPQRIGSMKTPAAKNKRIVQVAGDKKAKRLSTVSKTVLVKSGTSLIRKKKI